MKINMTMTHDCPEVEARNMIPRIQQSDSYLPPDEVWLAIMDQMSPTDIIAMTQVNHNLLRVGRDRILWRKIIKKDTDQIWS